MTPCGCKIRCIVDDIEEIVYCPTHANAFKLKEALEKIVYYPDKTQFIAIHYVAKQALSEIK